MSGASGLIADRVRIAAAASVEHIVVSDASFELPPGGTLGIAGESGCGKTALVQALFGYARSGLRILGGTVSFVSEAADRTRTAQRLAAANGDRDFERVRGRVIALVPQAASSVLDPIMTIGRQLEEIATVVAGHNGDASSTVQECLKDVGFADPERISGRYPHQLSGGQRQRVALSMALLAEPDVLVLDEATTDLDVVTQRRILGLIQELRRRHGFGVVAVSHDLRVLAELCSQLLVMYGGRIVEAGPTAELLASPRHPYTASLVARFEQGPLAGGLLGGGPGGDGAEGCVYRLHCKLARGECAVEPALIEIGSTRSSRCWRHTDVTRNPEASGTGADVAADAPRAARPGAELLLRVAGLEASHRAPGLLSRRVVSVLHGIDMELQTGEALGIVGESGSGKTTFARILVGLHPIDAGVATFLGRSLDVPAVSRPLELRRELQIVFQNPETAFNPRLRIRDVLERRLKLFEDLRGRAAARRIDELFADVGLPSAYADKLPHELSGGERQRTAISRALVGRPRLIVCDEVVSALDVESQARVVHLLKRLQDEHGISYILISHDMGVVAALAHRLIVFKDGDVVESGPTGRVLNDSQHPYTRELAAAAFVDVEQPGNAQPEEWS